MSREVSAGEAQAWAAWDGTATADAEKRWEEAKKAFSAKKSGAEWLEAIHKRLAPLGRAGLIDFNAHTRVRRIAPEELSPSARTKRDRVLNANPKIKRRKIYPISISMEETDGGDHGVIHLYPGDLLTRGSLSLLVFINEEEEVPVSMSIMLAGIRPSRQRSVYLRYDLDAVQMGTGSVAHFNSHWHSGDLPDAGDGEEFDSRTPSPILGPEAAIDILIKTFYPLGPAALLPEGTSFEAEDAEIQGRSMELSSRLESERSLVDKTAKVLGEETGLDQTFIADIESGKRGVSDIGIEAIEKLAVTLDVQAAWLAYGHGDKAL